MEILFISFFLCERIRTIEFNCIRNEKESTKKNGDVSADDEEEQKPETNRNDIDDE